jgi:hypothetical protein
MLSGATHSAGMVPWAGAAASALRRRGRSGMTTCSASSNAMTPRTPGRGSAGPPGKRRHISSKELAIGGLEDFQLLVGGAPAVLLEQLLDTHPRLRAGLKDVRCRPNNHVNAARSAFPREAHAARIGVQGRASTAGCVAAGGLRGPARPDWRGRSAGGGCEVEPADEIAADLGAAPDVVRRNQ